MAMLQILQDPISRSKAPFLTLKSPLSPLFNEARIVTNGALDLEIGPLKICHSPKYVSYNVQYRIIQYIMLTQNY